MKRFRTKVCGLTRASDAVLAAQLGCDMVGMVFYRKSPRFVNQRAAMQIVKAIPATVQSVGVFVDEEENTVLRVADRLRLDFVQLHGSESEAMVERLMKHGLKVIKAFAISRVQDWQGVKRSHADLVLVDHRNAKLPGGTGEQFDWSLAPKSRILNLVLAGGVSASNVDEGVRRFDPVMVDVNSSVETKPGVKSAAKLKRFFAECDRIRYGR